MKYSITFLIELINFMFLYLLFFQTLIDEIVDYSLIEKNQITC